VIGTALATFQGGGNTVKHKKNKKMGGDVLGISDTPASTTIPQATTDHGGHPKGIEIGEHRRHSGSDELRQSGGATGIDMGGGGSGTDISSDRD
jgi:hypothetical protein